MDFFKIKEKKKKTRQRENIWKWHFLRNELGNAPARNCRIFKCIKFARMCALREYRILGSTSQVFY